MKLQLVLLGLAAPAVLWAQKPNARILKIGNEISTYGEFDHMYQQNNQTAMTPVSRAEYLQLFTNYKLKVAEGRALRIDTTAQYAEDCKHYVSELNKSYMTDSTAERRMRLQMKNRLQEEIHAAHILVNVKPGASPADTMKAYNKIMEARAKVVAGADFSDVALHYSDDPSTEANKGDLGYFSALQMVQEFEDAAYNTPVGQTSNVIRTRFGYHIMHVYDRRPHVEYHVQNLMKFFRPNMTDADKAKLMQECDSIYKLASEGVDFPSLILKHTDDHAGAKNAGHLPWLSAEDFRRQGLAEFATEAAKLKAGEYSAPFTTRYGVHVIRLVETRSEKSKEEFEAIVKQAKMYSEKFANCGQIAYLNKLAVDYKFNWTKAGRDSVISIMTQAANLEERNARLSSLKIKIAKMKGKTIKGVDIVAVADKWRPNSIPSDNIMAIRNEILSNYEIEHLADKYADYSYAKREYTEGLLVYEVAIDRVWNAMPDSATIAQMYASHPKRYSAGGTFDGTLYFCKSLQDVAKVKQMVANGQKDQAASIAEKVVNGPIKQGDAYDDVLWPYGAASEYVVVDGTKTDGQPVELERVRGQIVTDYQLQEDAKLNAELRKKYNPEILIKID